MSYRAEHQQIAEPIAVKVAREQRIIRLVGKTKLINSVHFSRQIGEAEATISIGERTPILIINPTICNSMNPKEIIAPIPVEIHHQQPIILLGYYILGKYGAGGNAKGAIPLTEGYPTVIRVAVQLDEIGQSIGVEVAGLYLMHFRIKGRNGQKRAITGAALDVRNRAVALREPHPFRIIALARRMSDIEQIADPIAVKITGNNRKLLGNIYPGQRFGSKRVCMARLAIIKAGGGQMICVLCCSEKLLHLVE